MSGSTRTPRVSIWRPRCSSPSRRRHACWSHLHVVRFAQQLHVAIGPLLSAELAKPHALDRQQTYKFRKHICIAHKFKMRTSEPVLRIATVTQCLGTTMKSRGACHVARALRAASLTIGFFVARLPGYVSNSVRASRRLRKSARFLSSLETRTSASHECRALFGNGILERMPEQSHSARVGVIRAPGSFA